MAILGARCLAIPGAILLLLSPWQPWLQEFDGQTLYPWAYPFRDGDLPLLHWTGICCLVSGLLTILVVIVQASVNRPPRLLVGAACALPLASVALAILSVVSSQWRDWLSSGSHTTLGPGFTMCLVGSVLSMGGLGWLTGQFGRYPRPEDKQTDVDLR